jgi:hypothetical protein
MNEIHCSICLESYLGAVTCVPCGHSFCGQHVQEIWQRRGAKIACPQCRTEVVMTIPNYALRHTEVRRFANDNERQKVESDLREYNRTFANDPNEGTLSRVSRFFGDLLVLEDSRK